eukprot:GHRR01006287.1.p1 GENE.GHRR01006287.1~~GHRR01006287.1.p1  ORF type:complete len:494 (+),score=170.52 GHRR01006287.1:2730-4211(+)
MIKWNDQSRFRAQVNMEWYVLGNGPWDYTAVAPNLGVAITSPNLAAVSNMSTDLADSSAISIDDATATTANSSTNSALQAAKPQQVFGEQYSDYPNGPGTARTITVAQTGHDPQFNYVQTYEETVLKSLFRGELDGRRYAPIRTDYGSIYASMVFRTSDLRQIMFSWIYETAAGCQDSCSDQLPPVVEAQGFKGVQTLPRQLRYNRETKTLNAFPVAETALLRGTQVYNTSGVTVGSPANATILVPVSTIPAAGTGSNRSTRRIGPSSQTSNITARQFEVQLNFTVNPSGTTAGNDRNATSNSSSNAPVAFAVGVRILTGNNTYTEVFMNGTAVEGSQSGSNSTGGAAAWSIRKLYIWVDRTNAGGATNTSYTEGGPVPLPVTDNAWQLPEQQLGLSVWVDHSVIEAFAMGGLARVTSRVYPAGDDVAWGLAAWALPPSSGTAGSIAAAIPGVTRSQPASLTAAAAASRAAAQGVTVQAQVWEVNNAWLAPDC